MLIGDRSVLWLRSWCV